MSNNELVSIIMPSYNCGRYIEAKEVVEVLTALGRKGITTNLLPLAWGYKFEK